MRRMPHIPGAVLPTVTVVSVLLLLTVLTIASLWESDFLFFSRHRYDAMQRANVESGFALYSKHPEAVMQNLDPEGRLLLYDSIPHSEIKIESKAWGLYEVVSVSGHDGKIHASKIIGRRHAGKDNIALFYKNNNSALTLTGNTRLEGYAHVPRSGIIYGQMGSVFFNGAKIEPSMMKESAKELPPTDKQALNIIKELQELRQNGGGYLQEDSVTNRFYGNAIEIFEADGRLEHCRLSGNIVIVGDEIDICSSCRLTDILVAGNTIRIEDGFSGSLQAFASDSLLVGDNVILRYPSGVFSAKYIGIGDNSEINGYAIIDIEGEPDVRKANYKQSRLSTVRGLLYVSGTAQLQGIVSGAVFLNKAVYYSPRGYYENMICDATVLENRVMAWPFWLEGPAERKEVKWVR